MSLKPEVAAPADARAGGASPCPRIRMVAPRDVPELVARKGGLRLLLPGGEVVTVRGSLMPADWDRAGQLLVDGADGHSRLVPVTGRSRLDMVI